MFVWEKLEELNLTDDRLQALLRYLNRNVVFYEDDSNIRIGNAPANLFIVRAIALNILRRNGHVSITIATRFISNDIDKLL